MSYEPLHHKYRPKTFAELVGQEAIATTLTNAIHTLKIAPAYLFTGPRGTGKTSSARILAKSLNCLNSDKPTSQPCGKCNVCQGINKGNILDVIEIDAASNTGVDNIRELIERAQFAPVQCRYKVYVVDECHMLSTQAFNALLKTLEEPPRHVVFVLATTDPQRVLPTIISRCQRFDFRRIPIDAMVQHLSDIALKENINIAKDAVILVAQVAQGGLRDAESLLDQLGLLPGEVTPEKVWDLVGSVSERDLLDLLKAIISDNSEAVIDCTRKILDRGREPFIILQNLSSFNLDFLFCKSAPSRIELVACTQPMWEVLIDIAPNLEISQILQGQQHLRTAEVQIKNTTQPRLWLEVTLLGLLPSATIIQPPAISHRQNPPKFSSNPPQTNNHPPAIPDNVPSVQQTAPTAPPPHQPAIQNTVTPKQQENGVIKQHATSQPVASPPSHPPTPSHSSPPPQAAPATNLNQVWQEVLANLMPDSRRELLRQMCHLVEFDNSIARVAVKEKWYEKVKENQPNIQKAFQVTYNCEVQVNLQKTNAVSSVNSNSAAVSTPVQQNPPATPRQTLPQSPPQATLPVPETKKAPQISTPKTQPPLSRQNTVLPPQASSKPPETTPIVEENPEEEEVMKAARRLAEALDGEIIQFSEEQTEISDESIDSPELEEVEEDVEF